MFDNVVVGASDCAGGARAVRRGAELAGAAGGTVHIVTAFRGERVDALADEFRGMAAQTSVRIRTHLVQSDPVEAITRVAFEEGADLVVVGSQADHGVRRLSSVPQGVMDRVECAVLVV